MRWHRLAPHWPLAIPLAIAAWLRFQGLSRASHFGDAAEYVQVASSLAGNPLDLAYPDIEGMGPVPFVSQPPLVLYLFAIAIRLSGFEMGPLLVSALLGTATVAVVYAVANLLDGRWTATAAATFLAILPFHVRASREAQLDAAFTFFLTLTVLAALLWLHRPTDLRAVGLGAAWAATAFAKLPGILVVAILVAPLLYAVWRGPLSRRTVARQAALVAAPGALLLVLYTLLLWSLRATADLLAKLAWQAGRVAGTDTVSRPWHWYFTEVHVGLPAQLGPLLLVLALVGVAVGVHAWFTRPEARPGHLTLLAWAVVFLAFLVASDRKEWFYALPLNPALATLAALPVGAAVRSGFSHPIHALPLDADPARTGKAPGPHRHKTSPTRVDSQQRTPQGPPRPARPMALAVAVFAAFAAFAPATATVAGPGVYGTGVREAAAWVGSHDPDAIQVGSTLGRFTLHLYNGQPTYHYWLNHSFIETGIREGKVRYVVLDAYVSDPAEQAWLAGLVERHAGAVVHEHQSGGQSLVRVYRVA